MDIKGRAFELKAFSPEPDDGGIQIRVQAGRRKNLLELCYRVSGPLHRLRISPPTQQPRRMRLLWQSTCLECFIGLKGSDTYWEFNFSPAGHWNVYRFDHYRQGMCEEYAFTALAGALNAQAHELQLDRVIDLNRIDMAGEILQIGFSAVVQRVDGAYTYWALAHDGPQPDFHLRSSFIADLNP